MCTLFADNNFVIMLMCIVVHNLYLIIVSKLLTTTYCGLSDNSVRSVGTCNLCLMYYMASLASGGFVLTNGCLNHLFQVQVQESLHLLHIQVQEWFHVQLQD